MIFQLFDAFKFWLRKSRFIRPFVLKSLQPFYLYLMQVILFSHHSKSFLIFMITYLEVIVILFIIIFSVFNAFDACYLSVVKHAPASTYQLFLSRLPLIH